MNPALIESPLSLAMVAVFFVVFGGGLALIDFIVQTIDKIEQLEQENEQLRKGKRV
ncbi:hypothetical protein QUG02_11065 [Bacillus hominis]|uniref:Uncharacterized protein n=1 Tax=Bacillus hominis TaxID=2817478 RepID=A0ABT7R6V0_9BACI|nr:hypothetical protein [Bacillus hominis]MDM5193517.1 hypothetical protein [Bacillus hominis]MDM5433239.1 hypothetical protein [Bacillus hominis]MDM5438661.1 hypothetical protein [Bacillus hominis]